MLSLMLVVSAITTDVKHFCNLQPITRKTKKSFAGILLCSLVKGKKITCVRAAVLLCMYFKNLRINWNLNINNTLTSIIVSLMVCINVSTECHLNIVLLVYLSLCSHGDL